jgi:hypothetical protein
MTKFKNNFVYDYILRDTFTNVNVSIDNEQSFLYDYNEVQELYGNELDNDVYIVGVTALRKTDMLRLMVSNLLAGGIDERNIAYIDCAIPFVRNMGLQKICFHYAKSMTKDCPFYAVINEVTLCDDWARVIKKIKMKFPIIRFLCTSSISPAVHEYFYDNPDEKSKIIILSQKNESNIKHEQEQFGVFDEFKYNIKNGICEIKGLTKCGKTRVRYIIPESIKGFPVKVIASGAFHHRFELSEIVLPNTIEYIGDYAFTYCRNLQSITLPQSLNYIGDCTFLGATALKTIIGGENITHIGNSALYETKWLKDNKNDFVTLGKTLYRYKGQNYDVTIPTNINVIGFYAFADTAIRNVDLSGISNIAEGAFYNCEHLSKVSNCAVKAVSAFQFFNCTSLQKLPFTVAAVGKFAFSGCISLGKVQTSSDKIDDYAFENCVSLSKFSSNTPISAVGICAFYNAPLVMVDLSKVKSVGAFAYYNSKLQMVDMNAVREIRDFAFWDSRLLLEVNLSPSANIGKAIFLNCNKIRTATLGGKYRLNTYFGGESPIKKLRVIGDCVDNFCRSNNKIQDIDIQGDNIGNWAFYACKSLRLIKLSTKRLGAWSFAYCDAVKEITLPPNCEYISMNAFRYCHNLADITILTSKPLLFGANAFYSTAEDKHFHVPQKSIYLNIPVWNEYNNRIIESLVGGETKDKFV